MFPVAILVGGLGTRMSAYTSGGRPKALLPVAGRPFIDFKLAGLAAEGVKRVVLALGHGGNLIAEHVGDGSRYGLEVTCAFDGPTPLGTGGALRQAIHHLGEAFWVTYGDTYLRVPMQDAEMAFRQKDCEGMMTVLRNLDRWDRSNVQIEGELVLKYERGAPSGSYQYIDYGLSLLRSRPILSFDEGAMFDLQNIFAELIRRRAMAAYLVTRRFFEIGSPEGYRDTDRFMRSSKEWDRLSTRLSSTPKSA